MWGITLDRNSEITLSRQIYQALQQQMLQGGLQSGDPLPSTRELAKQLSVSRNTVYEAYEMLAAEGYIISRQGSPARVAKQLVLTAPQQPSSQLPVMPAHTVERFQADFRTGQPDLRHFPRQRWLLQVQQAAAQLPPEFWGYSGPEGFIALREQIAAWLLRSKGIAVDAQDVYITAGATHALHILAGLLPTAEKPEILVEDPCHLGMLNALRHNRIPIRPVPVDDQGLITAALPSANACAVYVTPSHQFPLGGILPAGRRTALVQYARKQDLYLIEDDYDSEFRYAGSPIAPLYSLDPQRVIYVGTFSKILFPALRIGYVILPRALQPAWRRLRLYTDVQNPPFEQAALAEFLRTRKLDRHIQSMRRLYGQRRQLLLKALTELLGTGWQTIGDAAGLHLALEYPGKCFDHSFVNVCRQHSLRIAAVDEHSIVKGRHLNKLLLGYGHLDAREISAGIPLLAHCIDQL